MKFIAITLLGFATVTAVLAAEDRRQCRDEQDCEKDECCTRRSTFVLDFRKGYCTKLAQKGESCSTDTDHAGKYFGNCDCAEGSTCVPTETKEIFGLTLKFDERCVVLDPTQDPDATTANPEEPTEEVSPDE